MSDTLRQLVERVEHTAEGDYFNRGQHIPANCLRCAFEAFLAQPCGSLGEMAERITDYLSKGGLFNPEHMEHDKVRELLMDCREALAANRAEREKRDKRLVEFISSFARQISDYGLMKPENL